MSRYRYDLDRAMRGIHGLESLVGRTAYDIVRQQDLFAEYAARNALSAADARASALDPAFSRTVAGDRHLQEMLWTEERLAKMMRAQAGSHRLFDNAAELGIQAELERVRAGRWSEALHGATSREMAALAPGMEAWAKDLTYGRYDLAGRADKSLMGAHWGSAYGLSDLVLEALNGTSLKMSVMAGVADSAGWGAAAFDDVTQGLIGDWFSRPDLPASFWRDRRVRERHYLRADVDKGLIAAPPLVAVEILVESGLASGASDQDGTVALLEFGGVAFSIRSTQAQVDAYRAVTAFERGLRDFIARKLEESEGPSWFKRRVDGEVVLKAKLRRETALKSGEKTQQLIHFTELGELQNIVLRGDNWAQVFEATFINRGRFEHDMLTLMAIRRPTAHARIIDSTQLVEALLVMRRLDDQMSNDGAWMIEAALDE